MLGHFGTKEELQLHTLRAAIDVFSNQVWEPSLAARQGLPRLMAICDARISYLERDVFPGGWFLTAASCEFDRVKVPCARRSQGLARWNRVLRAQARVANQAIQLLGDRDAAGLARRAMHGTLGLSSPLAGRMAHGVPG